MNVDELLDVIDLRISRASRRTITHGLVTQTDPLRVRLNDDTTDQRIAESISPVDEGQQIVLLRVGGDWIAIGALPGDTGWVDLAYQGDWETHPAGYGGAQYRKVGPWVKCRGLIRPSVAPVGADIITTLPEEARPSAREVFSPAADGDGYEASRLDVQTDGDVLYYGTGYDFVSLAQVVFLVG